MLEIFFGRSRHIVCTMRIKFVSAASAFAVVSAVASMIWLHFFSCFFCWSVLINAWRHATKFNIHDHTNPCELNTTKNQQLRVLSALNLLFFVTAMRYHSQISLRTWEGVYQANRTSIIQFIDHHLRQNFHAKAELQVLKLTHKDTRREKKIQSVFFIDSSNQSESTFYAWAHPVLIVF